MLFTIYSHPDILKSNKEINTTSELKGAEKYAERDFDRVRADTERGMCHLRQGMLEEMLARCGEEKEGASL